MLTSIEAIMPALRGAAVLAAIVLLNPGEASAADVGKADRKLKLPRFDTYLQCLINCEKSGGDEATCAERCKDYK